MKTQLSAIVLIPPEAAWPPIQAIRQRLDRQFSRWMPHITLIYPFRPAPEFEAVRDRILEACAAVQPFTFQLETFRSFSHGDGRYTMWLEPSSREWIVALQSALQARFPECDDVTRYPNGFTPHLSVGQLTGRVALEERITALQSSWRPISFEVRAASLICREEGEPFRVHENLPLGGARP